MVSSRGMLGVLISALGEGAIVGAERPALQQHGAGCAVPSAGAESMAGSVSAASACSAAVPRLLVRRRLRKHPWYGDAELDLHEQMTPE